jgi:hypothetical protein
MKNSKILLITVWLLIFTLYILTFIWQAIKFNETDTSYSHGYLLWQKRAAFKELNILPNA